MTKDCIFCQILNKKIPYKGIIKKFNHWQLIVSREQHTLGCCIIMLNRHIENFSEISRNEILELQVIQKTIEQAIKKLFQPNLFNYIQAGNGMPHLHIHFIPRYNKNNIFEGKEFTDEHFGDTVKETTTVESEEMIVKLRTAILGEIDTKASLNRLVRDKIPQIIKDANKIPHTHIATDKEYLALLKEKLGEEVEEFNEDESIDELADVMEIILAIQEVKQFSKEQVETARQKKANERGSFKDKIVLDSVELKEL